MPSPSSSHRFTLGVARFRGRVGHLDEADPFTWNGAQQRRVGVAPAPGRRRFDDLDVQARLQDRLEMSVINEAVQMPGSMTFALS